MTGAGGRIGAHVVATLAADTDDLIVALARRQLSLGAHGGQVVGAVADYADLPALRVALRDVDTLVLVSSDGPVAEVVVHHHNLIAAAADCGVTHVVALSGLDADQHSPFCYAVGNGYTEQMLRDSGCGFSIARASIYTEFLLAFVTTARAGGQLRLPAGDGQISPVCRGDVGRCLAALAIGPPSGRHHDITGPEALSLAAIAEIASQAWQSLDRLPADHPGRLPDRTGRRRRDPMVDLRVHVDVRVDQPAALDRRLQRGRADHRPGATPASRRARRAPLATARPLAPESGLSFRANRRVATRAGNAPSLLRARLGSGGNNAPPEQRCEDQVEGLGACWFAEDQRLDACAVAGGSERCGELSVADARGGV